MWLKAVRACGLNCPGNGCFTLYTFNNKLYHEFKQCIEASCKTSTAPPPMYTYYYVYYKINIYFEHRIWWNSKDTLTHDTKEGLLWLISILTLFKMKHVLLLSSRNYFKLVNVRGEKKTIFPRTCVFFFVLSNLRNVHLNTPKK